MLYSSTDHCQEVLSTLFYGCNEVQCVDVSLCIRTWYNVYISTEVRSVPQQGKRRDCLRGSGMEWMGNTDLISHNIVV